MNNLTTPPPVEELDPQYAEDLRAELVRNARGTRREWSVWTPILAAACGVAVITGGVVASTRGSGSSDPAGSPAPTPSSTVAKKVPDGGSERINLDRGSTNSFSSFGEAVGKRCLAAKTSAAGDANPAKPSDAVDYASYMPRWTKALPGTDDQIRPVKTKLLIQSYTTQAGAHAYCVDDQLMQVFDPAAGRSWEQSRNLSKTEPLNGQWTISQLPYGQSSLLFVSFSFAAMPDIVKVELRIRWTGGASPWYGVPVDDGFGYATASQAGAVHERGKMEVDYRALDNDDRVVFSGIEYG
ncbi:hypothetical protein OHA70_35490 [Kribbella sp. NBC_00382]|uniref:hypothetical protein n=1 Tax=Kribbella sp. NBC_00382 TaxID=2975967 RepID=UPI002E238834